MDDQSGVQVDRDELNLLRHSHVVTNHPFELSRRYCLATAIAASYDCQRGSISPIASPSRPQFSLQLEGPRLDLGQLTVW
jgi:hypothetical protein